MRKLEVLAPAGDPERLAAAIMYGADAVYLASESFGMRASANNFNDEELRQAVEDCHAKGIKVYLTCNVLANNNEIPALERALRKWDEMGVDALIISDIGIFKLASRIVKNCELHISTQAGVTNYLTANEFYEMGASRVVLARELSLEDIRTIRENTPPELGIEVFVHGAMCVSFSGRCLISQYMTGRDANHGECAQSCRWRYHLVEEKRPGQYFPIEETKEGTYFFNAQDMCVIEHLDKLAKAGVDSFKIEGRAKSAYYTSVVTNAYRCAVDILENDPDNYVLPEWLQKEPYKVSHRKYSTGFYFPDEKPGQIYETGGYVRGWEVTAIADGWENGELICTQRNKFSVGDELEILEPKKEPSCFKVEKIINSKGESVEDAPHPMEQLRIPYPVPVVKGALIRQEM